jgi:hypothetical protein
MAGRRRLKTLCDIRRYLASILNRIESGELDPAIGGKTAYIANILIGCIRDSELEERIVALEKQIEAKK